MYVDEHGNPVEAKDAEISLWLTVGEYYHLCRFRLLWWNINTIKQLVPVSDADAMCQVVA